MSSPVSTWTDRRGMFQTGKAVHEPAVRRTSQEGSGVADAVGRTSIAGMDKLEKTLSGNSASTTTTATSQRRRSSQGMFGNLSHHKRGSEDYAERRASHSDQALAGGTVSGWWNSTFRGYSKALPEPLQPTQTHNGGERKRGVME